MTTSSQQLQFAVRAINEASKVLKDVGSDVEDVGRKANSGGGGLAKFGGALGDVAKIAGGFVIGAGLMKLPGLLSDATRGAAEDAAATERLHQTFRNYANMVGAAPDTFERLNDLLDERIKIGQGLAFTDDQVRDSFNSLLTATDDSSEAVKRQAAAMDLARGANIPLEQATRMLGKISSENVEVFKKLGITLGENATEADALAAVQARFGGQAEAYAKSTAGQFEQTSIRMGELKEQIGAQLLPVMTKMGELLLNEVIPRMEAFGEYWATNVQPKVEEFVNGKFIPAMKAIWEYIRDVVMPAVKEQWGKFQTYYDTDIKPALDNIKTAIEAVVTFLKDHWGQIEPFVRPLFIAIQTAAEVALGAIKVAIDILGGDWEGAVKHMKEIWETIVGGFKDYFVAVKDQILVAVGLLKAGFEGIAGAIKGAFVAAINEIIGLINRAIEAYNKIPLAPNVPTIPTIGTGGGGTPPPTYGPDLPVYGPEPPVYGPFPGPGGGGGGRDISNLTASSGPLAPTGAYGKDLVWDPGANAWVLPWEVGMFDRDANGVMWGWYASSNPDKPGARGVGGWGGSSPIWGFDKGSGQVVVVNNNISVQGSVWSLDELTYELERRGVRVA